MNKRWRCPESDCRQRYLDCKKRYILNVHDNEGVKYKEPQLKIMGIEA